MHLFRKPQGLVHRKWGISGPGEESIPCSDWLLFKWTTVSWTRSALSTVFPLAARHHVRACHPRATSLCEPAVHTAGFVVLLFTWKRKKRHKHFKIPTLERFWTHPDNHQLLHLGFFICVMSTSFFTQFFFWFCFFSEHFEWPNTTKNQWFLPQFLPRV